MLRLMRDLLDQQIIDVNATVKWSRVTDVSFEVRHDERDSLMMLEVDVGVRSILRRLLQELTSAALDPPHSKTHISPNSIRWEFCNIVEADPLRRLRLNIFERKTRAVCTRLTSRILSRKLGPAEREEAIMGTIDSEVAADALSEIDPRMQASILEALEPEVAADIVEEMSPDEAAHALSELKEETDATEILDEMEKRRVVRSEGTSGIRRRHRGRHDEHRSDRAPRKTARSPKRC